MTDPARRSSPLAPIGPSLFHAETLLNMPGGMKLPARMTVMKLADGSLALHSPIRIDNGLATELEALGPVRYLIAPNRFHHLFAGKAHERWPDAALYAAPGVAEKRRDLRIADTIGDSLPRPLAGELDACVMGGSARMSEVVFFHRPSGALIATDFVFNIEKPEGFVLNLFTGMMGTRGKFAQSRMVRMVTNDRAANKASAERMLEWPIERVVMAHGGVVEDDAKRRLRSAIWWSLGEKPARAAARS